jgi:hypothetical protein
MTCLTRNHSRIRSIATRENEKKKKKKNKRKRLLRDDMIRLWFSSIVEQFGHEFLRTNASKYCLVRSTRMLVIVLVDYARMNWLDKWLFAGVFLLHLLVNMSCQDTTALVWTAQLSPLTGILSRMRHSIGLHQWKRKNKTTQQSIAFNMIGCFTRKEVEKSKNNRNYSREWFVVYDMRQCLHHSC